MDRRTYLGSIAGLSASTVAGCIGGVGSSVDEMVEVGPEGRFTFEPGTESPLRIEAGSTLRFKWRSDTHNIAVLSQPDGASWEGHEPIEDEGFSFSHTFEVVGDYRYVCEPHEGLGMFGELVVEPGG